MLSQSLPQGARGGTIGFQNYHMPIVVPGDRTITAGESIRVTVSVTNNCITDHPVRLAFDASGAPTRLDAVSLDPLPAQCLDSIDKSVTTYVKSRIGYLDKCWNGINGGAIAPQDCHTEPGTVLKLSKATAKAVKSILKKCNDTFIIGPPPGGIASAGCPGLSGGCSFSFTVLDDGTRGNSNDYVDCMLCMADSASSQMSLIQYQPPAAPGLDPTTDGCQVTIGKAAITFQNKKLKLLQNCRKLVNQEKYAGTCPDPKTVTRIASAQAKVGTQIAKICTSAPLVTAARPSGLNVTTCPGPPVACQGAIASVGDEATCMSCTHGFFDDCQYPATIGQSAPGCP